MKFLRKIEYLKIDESEHSFELRFHFAPNEYFTNEVLKKTFYMKEEDLAEKSVGTEIAWKEGKNITKKTIKKVKNYLNSHQLFLLQKQKNKKTGQTRVITKEVDDESFFNFFKSINVSDLPKKEGDDDVVSLSFFSLTLCQDEEGNVLAERMDIDLDIARTIVEEAIPYGLEYFLGIKLHEDHDDGDEGDDDEDEEESEEEDIKKKGKKPHKH